MNLCLNFVHFRVQGTYYSYKDGTNGNGLLVPTFCEGGNGVREIIIKGRFFKKFQDTSAKRKLNIRFEPRHDRIANGNVLMFPWEVRVGQTGSNFKTGDIKFLNNETFDIVRREKENDLLMRYAKNKTFPANYEFSARIIIHPTYYALKSASVSDSNLFCFFGKSRIFESRDGFFDNIRISGDDMEIISVEIKNGGMLPNRLEMPLYRLKYKQLFPLDQEKLINSEAVNILERNTMKAVGVDKMWELSLRGFIQPKR